MTEAKKSIRNLKDKKVQIRMSSEEKAQILERAKGTDISTFLRELGLGHEPKISEQKAKVVIHAADPELVREVAKIGNNINQIAKHLNITKELDRNVFTEILKLKADLDAELERVKKNDS